MNPFNMKNILILLAMFVFTSIANGQVYDKVVAKDGSGTSYSISSAIGRLSSGTAENPVLIYIKNGVYEEKITLGLNHIKFIGESVDGVVITNGDYSGDGTHSTASSYTLEVTGDDFYAENLTIINSAGNVGQAVAIKTSGDRQVYKNCVFKGFQDTYYAHSGMQYNLNCTVEGATDFVFGDATNVFKSCTINCVKGGQYITAPADSKLTSTRGDGTTMIHGLLFKDCDITSDSDVSDNSYFLGRPWQPNSSTVYMNCTLGSHVRALGWDDWNNDNHLSAYFAEYKSVDIEGNLIDTSNRVDWSYQMSDAYATDYYNLSYFFTKNEVVWDPLPLVIALDAPASLSGNVNVLSWDAVDSAIGYAVIRNDSTVGFSETNAFTDEEYTRTITNTYVVKAINLNGCLSEASNNYVLLPTGIDEVKNKISDLSITVSNHELMISKSVDVSIFTISGTLVKQKSNTQCVELTDMAKGVYIVKAMNGSNHLLTKKIILK